WWGDRVLPRLNRFLAGAGEGGRPLVLSPGADESVAFAAGYYFHTKTVTKISLLQVTAGQLPRWSEKETARPQGPLWQSFEENDEVLDPSSVDVALAVEITQSTYEAVKAYLPKLCEKGTKIGRLISARIAGEPGKTRVESGAHAYQLAWEL